MSDFINTIDALGDDVVLDSIINRTITEFKDDQLTTIGAFSFYGCSSLTTVDLPNVTTINNNAFAGCVINSVLNLPNVTTINNNAFDSAKLPERVCLPSFIGHTNVDSWQRIFQNTYGIKHMDLPNCEYLPTRIFIGNYSLETINIPKVKIIGMAAFYGGSMKIELIDLPVCIDIRPQAFQGLSSLKALILRNTDTVCELGDTTMAINNTLIASGTGYIYVPAALIEDYKVATNWSTYAAQFRVLEDYTVDGTITGELRKYAESISLDVTELTFTDENSYTLTPTGVFGVIDPIVWSSSDHSVAVVKNGIVTPLRDGTTTITATCRDVSATCLVTVNAGLELTNILGGVSFNTGFLNNNGAVGSTTSANDTYTDKFDISNYAGTDIVVTLYDVKSTASNSRICYYDANNNSVGYQTGVSSSDGATITSTVPTNAVYAAISVNKSGGFSGIIITLNDSVIGSIDYTS